MTDNGNLDILKQKPITAWEYPRILVGVLQEKAMPHAEHLFYQYWAIAMQGVSILRMPYNRIDVTRNRMVVELLRSEMTHLLMLDIDHKHPANIIQRLARWVLAEPHAQVVSGLNFRRSEPFDPCCGFWGKDGKYYPPAEWEQGLIKVDAVGGASLLISREVFEIIPPPWFAFDYSRVWADEWPGEDVMFSRLCGEYGIDIYVDTTTTSPHMTSAMITEDTFKKHLQESDEGTTSYDEFMETMAEQASG
jgi:hypothetical protein